MSASKFSIPVHPTRDVITKTDENGDDVAIGRVIEGFTSFELVPVSDSYETVDELAESVETVISTQAYTFGEASDEYYKVYDETRGGLIDIAIETGTVVLYVKESSTESIVETIVNKLSDEMGEISVTKQAVHNNEKERVTETFSVS